MKLLLFTTALVCYLHTTLAEETRLLDLEPTDAQQVIESQDQTLKYAPKVDTNVPAVRFLGNEPHNVLEDIYLARQYHGQDGLGGYLYGYSVPDIAKNEKKKAGGDLKGAYQYINGQGQEIKVEYWDDGTGFHQIDNVPKILPKQIDDSPEVKAAKDSFLKRWHEEAERNQHPVQNPYNSEGQYAIGPLSVQGQRERQRQFAQQQFTAQSNYPHTSGNQYQQAGNQQFSSQYRPQGVQQGGQYQSGQYQSGGQPGGQYQQGGQYQSGQYQTGQPGGQYQQGGQYQSGAQGGQYQSGQYKPGSQQGNQQYGGQYQSHGSPQSGPYQQSHQQSGSSAGYYPGGAQQSSGASFGQNTGAYGQSQPSHGQISGSYGQAQGSYGKTSYSSSQNQIDYSGQGSESKDIYATGPQQGKHIDEENEEPTGPPKGFFYSYDYPVGIIVQKQGALRDVYSANKANFQSQLQQGRSSDGSSQQGYHVN